MTVQPISVLAEATVLPFIFLGSDPAFGGNPPPDGMGTSTFGYKSVCPIPIRTRRRW